MWSLLSRGRVLTFNAPLVMGVINRSPNSFYAPCQTLEQGLVQAEAMLEEGADILDIGGEATNPFVDIPLEAPEIREEIERVIPLLKAVRQRHPEVLISVDTSNAAVMQAAIDEGADMINDQRALRRAGALEVVVNSDIAVCLMHMFIPVREPGSDSMAEMTATIRQDLSQWAQQCETAGIDRRRIVLDPGFGGGNFGKNTDENCYLMKHLSEIQSLGYPLLAGWSRKSMLGDILSADVDQRLYGSVAAATLAAYAGVQIIRVHDVKPTVDAVKVVCAIQ